jgi:hypothetical protein
LSKNASEYLSAERNYDFMENIWGFGKAGNAENKVKSRKA